MQCHGEHTLVEIFNKRNFTCDCGTTRFPASSPCSLRLNPKTNTKGGVHSEEPSPNNKYNQNFRNRFCGCECDYDPFQQKGTMFQCLGLGTIETGGCGEDWYHSGCVVGLGPKWYEEIAAGKVKREAKDANTNGSLPTIAEDGDATEQGGDAAPEEAEDEDDNDLPPPPGFPAEEDFDGFICYKCVEAHPWVKRYAGTPGFLAPVYHQNASVQLPLPAPSGEPKTEPTKKRKADDEDDNDDNDADSQTSKRPKNEPEATPTSTEHHPAAHHPAEPHLTERCRLTPIPSTPPPPKPFSLFFTSNFRDHLCRCPACFPLLAQHPQLLEEEETYEPPVSESGDSEQHPAASSGGGSLYDRGESALRAVDRVRAIEGVMAYQHLKDKLMPFFQQFAESKQAISAEDVKEYFAKLRGDDEAIREAGEGAASGRGEGGDTRTEERGC